MNLDFAALDARIDARLAALGRRASGGVSFAADDGDDRVSDLARLLALARGVGHDEDAALHFAADADQADEGPLAHARRECAAFFRDVWRELGSLALVRTGALACTRVGWTGDATTALARDITPAEAAAHAAAVQAARASLLRSRSPTMKTTTVANRARADQADYLVVRRERLLGGGESYPSDIRR